MKNENISPNLTPPALNEYRTRLANLALQILEAENCRATGEPVAETLLENQFDELLEEIVHKAEGGERTLVQPLMFGSEEPEKRRVVITGLGTINPLAQNVPDYWEGLKNGQSGIARMTLCDPSNYPTKVTGEVKEWNPKKFIDAKDARRMSCATQFAVAAATEAIKHAKLEIEGDMAEDYGVLIGTGNAAFPETEAAMRVLMEKGGNRVSPLFIPTILPNMPAGQIALTFGLKGYNSTVVTACSASTQAIGEAMEVIKRGEAEVMISGGTEAPISELGLAGFCAMRAMSSNFSDDPPRSSRPFDKQRDGFVPGEGAGIVVLENLEHALARNARIYAEVIGYGCSCDAYHLVAPDPAGLGAVRAMRRAIHHAKINPRDIDYINAHGTSTEYNDKMETIAVKKVFGDYAYNIPMSSIKSMIGHLLGGAGGVEAIATILMMQNSLIAPTINYEEPDPDCDLDYVPNKARPASIKIAMSNKYGFGGQNASLIFREYKPE